MPPSTIRIAATLLTVLAITGSLKAQNAGRPAYTEPPENDPSYELMGEFIGVISPGDASSGDGAKQMLGLQIRPIGGNQFDAVSFAGGLPGQDLYQPKPMRMIGQRSSDGGESFVVLSGGPWAIVVERDSCLILDRRGKDLGRLERIVRSSSTLGATPPDNALVLFDGNNTDQFSGGRMTDAGLLMEGADLKPMFQDFNLHLEFRLPFMPESDGQARANSGVYLQSRYECQILDSFAQDPKYNGCGALYRFRKPDLNMCLPPLAWQTYDVQFTAPRWSSDGTKIRDAHITSWLNGVKVQDDIALADKTGAGKPEAPTLLPIRFQNHGDPVRFRNIWIVDRGLTPGEFPIRPSSEELAATRKADQTESEPAVAETTTPNEAAEQQPERSTERLPSTASEETAPNVSE